MPTHGANPLVFVTYLTAPQDESRKPDVQKIVRSRALRARHEASRSLTSVQAKKPEEREDVADQRSHMRRFRLKKSNTAAPDIVAQQPPNQLQIQYVPALAPLVESLGPHTVQLLDYCMLPALSVTSCTA